MTIRNLYLVLFLVVLFAIGCSSNNSNPAGTQEEAIPVHVNLTINDTLSNYTSASGKLVSKNTVNISTRIMGYITAIHTTVGKEVRAGQLLVNVNATDIQAKGGQINAQILQAQSNYNAAKKDYERFQNLFSTQSATQKELDDMRTRYEMAKAGLEAVQQMKKEVAAQLNYSNIESPISGVVTARYADPGDMANPGMPILTIESPSSLQAQIFVSESNIRSVKQGMNVQLTIKSINKTVKGVVSEISRSASGTGGQYLIKADIENATGLLPGMFVNAQFPFESGSLPSGAISQKSVMIPESAIVEKGQLTGIYVISTQQTALLRWIRIGERIGEQVEVLSGLGPDEKYIVSSEGKLYNGAKVRVVN